MEATLLTWAHYLPHCLRANRFARVEQKKCDIVFFFGINVKIGNDDFKARGNLLRRKGESSARHKNRLLTSRASDRTASTRTWNRDKRTIRKVNWVFSKVAYGRQKFFFSYLLRLLSALECITTVKKLRLSI